jgi:hypothetical protein
MNAPAKVLQFPLGMSPTTRQLTDSVFERNESLAAPDSRSHVEGIEICPGTYAWQVTGDSADDVQREITRLMNDPTVERSEFYNPTRVMGENYKYRSRGYTASIEQFAESVV